MHDEYNFLELLTHNDPEEEPAIVLAFSRCVGGRFIVVRLHLDPLTELESEPRLPARKLVIPPPVCSHKGHARSS